MPRHRRGAGCEDVADSYARWLETVDHLVEAATSAGLTFVEMLYRHLGLFEMLAGTNVDRVKAKVAVAGKE